ncbi:acylphosphatase [bacterium]|nr:acylphosphatase [bacterium]
MPVCVKVTVKGRVQGVGFRWFVQRAAQGLSVKGYVKNLFNGDVEAELEGKREAVEDLIKQIRKGPTFSRVDELIEQRKEYQGQYTSFSVDF